jgi:hypothetical protein
VSKHKKHKKDAYKAMDVFEALEIKERAEAIVRSPHSTMDDHIWAIAALLLVKE